MFLKISVIPLWGFLGGLVSFLVVLASLFCFEGAHHAWFVGSSSVTRV